MTIEEFKRLMEEFLRRRRATAHLGLPPLSKERFVGWGAGLEGSIPSPQGARSAGASPAAPSAHTQDDLDKLHALMSEVEANDQRLYDALDRTAHNDGGES